MKKLEKTRSQESYFQADLLIGQVDHMAELIDRLRLQIKEQQMAIITKDQHINNLNKAIVAKDQHINNLNKAIVAKDQHIANLDELIRNRDAEHYQNLMNLTKEIVRIKKYSVFYNLLSRFRRELLMWFGKSKE